MATRSQVREVVVQLLQAYGSRNEGISKFVEEIFEEQKIKNAQKDFALKLFSGAVENLESLDLRITHQLKDWDFGRIGEIERAILRLGAYEIVFSKTDKAIVINEALEIAKSFSYELSAKFINGVLDGIAKNNELPLEEIRIALEQQRLAQETNQKSLKDSEVSQSSEALKSNVPKHSKQAKNQMKSKPKRDSNLKKRESKKDFVTHRKSFKRAK